MSLVLIVLIDVSHVVGEVSSVCRRLEWCCLWSCSSGTMSLGSDGDEGSMAG